MQPHNPIEHVVIIVKENHSFDNYFGSFSGANGTSLPPAQDPPAGGDGCRGGRTQSNCNTAKKTFPHISRSQDNLRYVTTTSRKWPANLNPTI
jgi:phospholipase C